MEQEQTKENCDRALQTLREQNIKLEQRIRNLEAIIVAGFLPKTNKLCSRSPDPLFAKTLQSDENHRPEDVKWNCSKGIDAIMPSLTEFLLIYLHEVHLIRLIAEFYFFPMPFPSHVGYYIAYTLDPVTGIYDRKNVLGFDFATGSVTTYSNTTTNTQLRFAWTILPIRSNDLRISPKNFMRGGVKIDKFYNPTDHDGNKVTSFGFKLEKSYAWISVCSRQLLWYDDPTISPSRPIRFNFEPHSEDRLLLFDLEQQQEITASIQKEQAT
jgi:hypothetical protein